VPDTEKNEYIKALIAPSPKTKDKELLPIDLEKINSTNINRISPAQLRNLEKNQLDTILSKDKLIESLSPAQIVALPKNSLNDLQKNRLANKRSLTDLQTDK
jgi:ABC-type lipoprotein export system ATPase subunit